MRYGLKRAIHYVLGTDVAGRSLAVYPDDTFIVSYPRSGNTWTRFLVGNLVSPDEPATFANIERLVPDAEAQSSRYLKRVPRPRVIKSHQYFDHRYPKVVYIVRDPRDVALSYYNFQRKYRQIDDSFELTRYVSDFVHGRLNSAGWGTWAENVGSWVGARGGQSNFLLLRYEEMMANTVNELGKAAAFFGIAVTPQRLATAVERSSADRMRQLEKTQGGEWVSTKDKREDIPFIGAASPGMWKAKLPESSVAEIESAWAPLMAQLGYELMNPPDEPRATSERAAFLQPAAKGPAV